MYKNKRSNLISFIRKSVDFFWGFIEFLKNNFDFLRKFVGSIFNETNRTLFLFQIKYGTDSK